MKRRKNRTAYRVFGIVLTIVLIANTLIPGIRFDILAAMIEGETEKVTASFESVVDNGTNTEKITLTATAVSENIKVNEINIPGDIKIPGNIGVFNSHKNDKYEFTVYYEETIPATEEGKSPTKVSGSKVFSYTSAGLENPTPLVGEIRATGESITLTAGQMFTDLNGYKVCTDARGNISIKVAYRPQDTDIKRGLKVIAPEGFEFMTIPTSTDLLQASSITLNENKTVLQISFVDAVQVEADFGAILKLTNAKETYKKNSKEALPLKITYETYRNDFLDLLETKALEGTVPVMPDSTSSITVFNVEKDMNDSNEKSIKITYRLTVPAGEKTLGLINITPPVTLTAPEGVFLKYKKAQFPEKGFNSTGYGDGGVVFYIGTEECENSFLYNGYETGVVDFIVTYTPEKSYNIVDQTDYKGDLELMTNNGVSVLPMTARKDAGAANTLYGFNYDGKYTEYRLLANGKQFFSSGSSRLLGTSADRTVRGSDMHIEFPDPLTVSGLPDPQYYYIFNSAKSYVFTTDAGVTLTDPADLPVGDRIRSLDIKGIYITDGMWYDDMISKLKISANPKYTDGRSVSQGDRADIMVTITAGTGTGVSFDSAQRYYEKTQYNIVLDMEPDNLVMTSIPSSLTAYIGEPDLTYCEFTGGIRDSVSTSKFVKPYKNAVFEILGDEALSLMDGLTINGIFNGEISDSPFNVIYTTNLNPAPKTISKLPLNDGVPNGNLMDKLKTRFDFELKEGEYVTSVKIQTDNLVRKV